MKKMFGNYNTSKKSNSKKTNINNDEQQLKSSKKSVSPKKSFCSFEEKIHHCNSAKEYELIKEEFLQSFKKKFSFEDEISSWIIEENVIL